MLSCSVLPIPCVGQIRICYGNCNACAKKYGHYMVGFPRNDIAEDKRSQELICSHAASIKQASATNSGSRFPWRMVSFYLILSSECSIFIPNCPLDEHPCRDILRKHVHSLRRLHSLPLNFGTLLEAKDRASSFREGLLRTTRQAA